MTKKDTYRRFEIHSSLVQKSVVAEHACRACFEYLMEKIRPDHYACHGTYE